MHDTNELVKVVTIGTDDSREEVSYVNGEIGNHLLLGAKFWEKKTMELIDGTHEETSYLNGTIGKISMRKENLQI